MSTARRSHVPLCALLGLLAACITWGAYQLPSPVSARREPPSGSPGLRAGFGRIDITPPPGLGLAGYGPEARVATGYRLRLYARALVVEDSSGELVALVVADLPLISPNLQRLTARRIRDWTPIGADRLVLSATHTHAAPSQFFAERQYNQDVSSVTGYDSVLVAFLVSRMSEAVIQAYGHRRPARVGWLSMPVWGHTRNRSYDAFLRNKPEWTPPFPPRSGLDPAQQAVDPTWTLVRVDLRGGEPDTGFYPAGAFSIFAMHGTGNPSPNDLFDADIQGIVERGLERHIDSLNDMRDGGVPEPPRFTTRAVHLFANGTEGDVSPDWPRQSRCELPALRPVLGAGGPRTPSGRWAWEPPARAGVARCLAAARSYVNALGDSLVRQASGLFDRLRPRLTRDVSLAVAFRTIPLRGNTAQGLCPTPEFGPSTLVGAKDGQTRLLGWRLFGILPIGLEEGGSAVNPNPAGCQGEKRVVLGSPLGRVLHRWLIGRHGFPDTTQLAVVRLGGLLFGAVPAEVTTMAGAEMKRAMADSARNGGLRVDQVAIVTLANGYMSYVTTAAEYSAQDYEGGSNLFGPGTSRFLATRLAELVAALARGGEHSPPSVVTPFTAYPGFRGTHFTVPRGPPPDSGSRRFLRSTCERDTLVSRWLDASSSWCVPAAGQLLSIERQESNGWVTVAWDDQPEVEVRLSKWLNDRSAAWEVRWARRDRGGRYRVSLLSRGPRRAVSDVLSCP